MKNKKKMSDIVKQQEVQRLMVERGLDLCRCGHPRDDHFLQRGPASCISCMSCRGFEIRVRVPQPGEGEG